MRTICICILLTVGETAYAQPFKSEDNCFAFLSDIDTLAQAYLGKVDQRVDTENLDKDDPLFTSLKTTGQSLVDLRRDVAGECTSMRPVD